MQPLHVFVFRRLICVAWAIALGTAAFVALFTGLAGSVQARPLGEHCRDLPTPFPEWCGCTWGVVYVNGIPVSGARVTMTFSNTQIAATTRVSLTKDGMPYAEGFPYYDLRGSLLGSDTHARYGDVATFTVAYRGQTVTRTLRMFPTGIYTGAEQEINFVFPKLGQWTRLSELPDVTALATQSETNVLWAGTTHGLFRFNLNSGVSQTVDIGLLAPKVQAIATTPSGDVWAGTDKGLSRYANGVWTVQATGLSSISALAVADNGDVWAGSDANNTGGVSRFNGSFWQPNTLSNFGGVKALAVDSSNHVWVGTDNDALRWNGTTWDAFNLTNVHGIATEPGAVWLATHVKNPARVSRYDLNAGTWRVYTDANHLGSAFQSVMIDDAGRKWFGTDTGVSVFDDLNWFNYDTGDGLFSGTTILIVPCGVGGICASTGQGIDRLVNVVPGTPPKVTAVTARVIRDKVILSATASDTDSKGQRIITYDWRSSLNGLLGAEANYEISTASLSTGTHAISVRVMDDEGVWSEPMTTTLILPQWTVFLPMLLR